MDNSKAAYQLQILFNEKITKFYHDSYKGLLGNVQVAVLDYLYRVKESRTQDVADALLIPKQHASKIILRLAELELIESKPSLSDKRTHIFRLSDKGFQLIEEHISGSNKHFEQLLEKLSDKDNADLMNSMSKIVEILEKL